MNDDWDFIEAFLLLGAGLAFIILLIILAVGSSNGSNSINSQAVRFCQEQGTWLKDTYSIDRNDRQIVLCTSSTGIITQYVFARHCENFSCKLTDLPLSQVTGATK